MVISNLRARLFSICLALCFTAGLALSGPVAAIQNIGFPDDQSLVLNKADLTRFQTAQKAMQDALKTLLKFEGIDGVSKDQKVALQVISHNAHIIQTIARSAGNSDIATFMATLKTWSTPGDGEGTPKLVRKIEASLMGLKVRTK